MAISIETFFLPSDGQGTLQAQIQQMVAEGILAGRFRRGEKMPSSRKLATHLGISRITVTLAYTELVANDYLTSRGRSGYFVSETAPEPLPDIDRPQGTSTLNWDDVLGHRFDQSNSPNYPSDWSQYRYPFIYGQADPELFDHAHWRMCAIQALGQKDFAALTADYYDQDDPQLIEFILRHSLPRRGIAARSNEVLVTMGAQNALWLAAQILLTDQRKAAIENPCYPTLRNILDPLGCQVVPIDVDGAGMPPERIPADTDVVFTTPSHHCPSSATMPRARRDALLKAAENQDLIVVEDDYEFEMSFLSPPLPALKSLDRDGRVIYVGSFSKALFPGLRLGYLVGPEPFIREARALRANVLRHPPGHIQRTAAYFLRLGHYDTQIRRMGQVLSRRRKVMEQAIAAQGLQIAGAAGFGGSSFWMKAPDGIDMGQKAKELRSQGVLVEPGARFFGPVDPPLHYYRLAYSSIPEARIPDGIAKIARALG